jgi:hypothetical protein
LPALQTPLSQSPEKVHAALGAQRGHVAPPQSTSLSAPFFTPSAQDATWQWLDAHTLLAQSPPAPHSLPAPHAGHPPPQSASVSPPFFV